MDAPTTPPPTGPIIDGLERLVAFVRDCVAALWERVAAALALVAERVELRVEAVERRVAWWGLVLLVVVLFHRPIGDLVTWGVKAAARRLFGVKADDGG